MTTARHKTDGWDENYKFLTQTTVGDQSIDWYFYHDYLGGDILGRYGDEGHQYWSMPVDMITEDRAKEGSDILKAALAVRKEAGVLTPKEAFFNETKDSWEFWGAINLLHHNDLTSLDCVFEDEELGKVGQFVFDTLVQSSYMRGSPFRENSLEHLFESIMSAIFMEERKRERQLKKGEEQ